MAENDKIILEAKGSKQEIELPRYGEITFTIQNGKIISSSVTDKNKYY